LKKPKQFYRHARIGGHPEIYKLGRIAACAATALG
jgi:hypothetical protein